MMCCGGMRCTKCKKPILNGSEIVMNQDGIFHNECVPLEEEV